MDDDLVGIHACIDRQVPPKPRDERMALVRGAAWNPGDIIRIAFLDGDRAVQDRVASVAREWLRYANLEFYFGQEANAEIRVTFRERGSWSYVGTQCRNIPAPEPTMNYGWLTASSSDEDVRSVVLHEFGHALGCIHEHQNPDGGIQWNKPVVYDYYAGPPNHWSPAEVDHNVIATYDRNMLLYTPVDGSSIMMYPIDERLTLNGFSVGLNTDLSSTDSDFIASVYG